MQANSNGDARDADPPKRLWWGVDVMKALVVSGAKSGLRKAENDIMDVLIVHADNITGWAMSGRTEPLGRNDIAALVPDSNQRRVGERLKSLAARGFVEVEPNRGRGHKCRYRATCPEKVTGSVHNPPTEKVTDPVRKSGRSRYRKGDGVGTAKVTESVRHTTNKSTSSTSSTSATPPNNGGGASRFRREREQRIKAHLEAAGVTLFNGLAKLPGLAEMFVQAVCHYAISNILGGGWVNTYLRACPTNGFALPGGADDPTYYFWDPSINHPVYVTILQIGEDADRLRAGEDPELRKSIDGQVAQREQVPLAEAHDLVEIALEEMLYLPQGIARDAPAAEVEDPDE